MQVYNRRQVKLTTSKLNSSLQQIYANYKPPSIKGKEIKFNYATQVSTSPPLIAIFTNHPDLITESYKRYINNNLRKEFNFTGVPIRISFRKK